MNRADLLEQSILKIKEYARYGSKPGLERVRELLRRLGDPHKNLNVIHVGGTNGKGSVCRYVYSVLQRAGYRCGLYISPYIEEFTERIEFDGAQISPEDLARLTDRVVETAEEIVKEGLESPTEFEIITAIAFLYYKEKKADAVILEVGLGGRGDATNVIEKPLVVCIASVSMDHMDYLGDSIEQIAREKSGIIKPGVPLVYASEVPSVRKVLEETAEERHAPVCHMSPERIRIREDRAEGIIFDARTEHNSYEDLMTGMPGEHQAMNALCALQMLDLLKEEYGFRIPPGALKTGISEAKQPGRIEILKKDPYVVLDGSHNADSVAALCRWIRAHFAPEDRLLIVTGVLKDKEYKKIAGMLTSAASDFIVTEPVSPRKLPAEDYMDVIRRSLAPDGTIEICKDPREAALYAYDALTKKKNGNLPIKGLIFTGSLYMIGEARKTLKSII